MLKANLICEIQYLEWQANVVIVRKSKGKWRICIVYTDLDKACSKDSYHLPFIDQLIDATVGHFLLSFLDAFSRYHQIRMAMEDIPKITFITYRAVYAFKAISFRLVNIGAMYQRMMIILYSKGI